MFQAVIGEHSIVFERAPLPSRPTPIAGSPRVDDRTLQRRDGNPFALTIRDATGSLLLSFATRIPSGDHLFAGCIVLPESRVALVAFGRQSHVFDLRTGAASSDLAIGSRFQRWERHGDLVLLVAEEHLAAWDAEGKHRWELEGDDYGWQHIVEEDCVRIVSWHREDTFDKVTGAELTTGPAPGGFP